MEELHRPGVERVGALPRDSARAPRPPRTVFSESLNQTSFGVDLAHPGLEARPLEVAEQRLEPLERQPLRLAPPLERLPLRRQPARRIQMIHLRSFRRDRRPRSAQPPRAPAAEGRRRSPVHTRPAPAPVITHSYAGNGRTAVGERRRHRLPRPVADRGLNRRCRCPPEQKLPTGHGRVQPPQCAALVLMLTSL